MRKSDIVDSIKNIELWLAVLTPLKHRFNSYIPEWYKETWHRRIKEHEALERFEHEMRGQEIVQSSNLAQNSREHILALERLLEEKETAIERFQKEQAQTKSALEYSQKCNSELATKLQFIDAGVIPCKDTMDITGTQLNALRNEQEALDLMLKIAKLKESLKRYKEVEDGK